MAPRSRRRRRSRSLDSGARLVAATNLCVAYAVQHAFAKAEKICSRAVAFANTADHSTLLRRGTSASAKALNNRGVVRALRGDTERAAADLRRAALLAGTWAGPERNLLVLGTDAPSEPAVAQSVND